MNLFLKKLTLTKVAGPLVLLLLLLGLPTKTVWGQAIDHELGAYLRQLDITDYRQYEMVVIYPPHRSWMVDNFWLDHFMEEVHEPFAQILFVLVVEDEKQLNDILSKALKRPNLVIDRRFLFYQQSFYSHHPLLLQLKDGLVERETMITTPRAYKTWTQNYLKFKGRGKRKIER
jgi:hypothetical protein